MLMILRNLCALPFLIPFVVVIISNVTPDQEPAVLSIVKKYFPRLHKVKES